MKTTAFLISLYILLFSTSISANPCPKFVLIPYHDYIIPISIYDKTITEPDLDCDEIIDTEDDDIDGDGVPNTYDAFPINANENVDTDNDGIGNNADMDDDNDGYSDAKEIAFGSDPLDANSVPSATVLTKLTLSTEKTNFIRQKEPYSNHYVRIREPVKVMATYNDGHSEEVTDNVIWSGENYAKAIKVISDKLAIGNPKDTNITLIASIGTVSSNVLEIDISNEEEKLLDVEVFNNDKQEFPNRDAGIKFSLMHKTTDDVKLKLTLNESDGVKFYDAGRSRELTLTKELTFNDSNITLKEGYVIIVDQDVNNTNPYTIITELLESEDLRFSGEDPKDIIVTPNELKLIAPPIIERRGAIRGVTINFRVRSDTRSLTYELIDPPVGMKIKDYHDFDGAGMLRESGGEVEWNVPMDIEEKIYTISTKATDIDGNTAEISFDIKIPKTTLIETSIVNNELIVTDKNSTLYGMKMKGHSGEDISDLRLRSVDYGDVWKKKIIPLDTNKEIDQIVYIIDNVPNQLDIKYPDYMSNFEEDRIKKGININQYLDGRCILNDCWGWMYGTDFLYENTDGVTIPKVYGYGSYKTEGSKLFLITINEK